jgi:hypothetical protein
VSLVFDLHGWRGFSSGSDLFDHRVTAGWVTVIVDRQSVPERVLDLTNTVNHLRKRLRMLRDSLDS